MLINGLVACTWSSNKAYKVTFAAPGVASVTVESPHAGGKPKLSAMAAVNAKQAPAGVKVLSRPVHVETKSFKGTGSISFGYDPTALSGNADPSAELTVMQWVPAYGQWFPMGGDVDSVHHTITVNTSHFSDWTIAETDPDALATQQQIDRQLSTSVGGQLAQLMTGVQEGLNCSTKSLLLPAELSDPLALTSKLCEEVLPDGSYRLQVVNTDGIVRRFALPPGIDETARTFELDPLISAILGQEDPSSGSPNDAIVPDGGNLDVSFTGSAVTSDTVIPGKIDWSLYVATTVKQILDAAVLAVDSGQEEKLKADVGEAMSSAKGLLQCVVTQAVDVANTRNKDDIPGKVVTAAVDCAPDLLDVVKVLIEKLGEAGGNVILKSIAKRIDMLAQVPKLLAFARSILSGIPLALGTLTGAETAESVKPVRYMTLAEVEKLVHPTPGITGDCLPLPPDSFLPAGAPLNVKCVYAESADMDGNGKPDQLVLWSGPQVKDDDGSLEQGAQGAVVYLDDGTFHLLENPVLTWPGASTDGLGGSAVYPGPVVKLGADSRQEVLASYLIGANTNWYTFLTLGKDRHLYAATSPDTAKVIGDPIGGGAGYESRDGCVLSRGKPLLALSGDFTVRNGLGVDTGYVWNIEYYELQDHYLVYVGGRSGYSDVNHRPTRDAQSGTSCENLTKPFPEIGPVGHAATGPGEAVSALLEAVGAGDTPAAEQFLGSADEQWQEGVGIDTLSTVSAALGKNPANWVGQPISCGQSRTGPSNQTEETCNVTASDGSTMALLTSKTMDGWVVAGAIETASAPLSKGALVQSDFLTPSKHIICGRKVNYTEPGQPTEMGCALIGGFGKPDTRFAQCSSPAEPAAFISMAAAGPVSTSDCAAEDAKTINLETPKPVPYGSKVNLGPAVCTIEPPGIRCTQPDGHGFLVSSVVYKTF